MGASIQFVACDCLRWGGMRYLASVLPTVDGGIDGNRHDLQLRIKEMYGCEQRQPLKATYQPTLTKLTKVYNIF